MPLTKARSVDTRLRNAEHGSNSRRCSTTSNNLHEFVDSYGTLHHDLDLVPHVASSRPQSSSGRSSLASSIRGNRNTFPRNSDVILAEVLAPQNGTETDSLAPPSEDDSALGDSFSGAHVSEENPKDDMTIYYISPNKGRISNTRNQQVKGGAIHLDIGDIGDISSAEEDVEGYQFGPGISTRSGGQSLSIPVFMDGGGFRSMDSYVDLQMIPESDVHEEEEEEEQEDVTVVELEPLDMECHESHKACQKHPLQDSAYQSKEQSTDQCTSIPMSTTVSPTQLSKKQKQGSKQVQIPILQLAR